MMFWLAHPLTLRRPAHVRGARIETAAQALLSAQRSRRPARVRGARIETI